MEDCITMWEPIRGNSYIPIAIGIFNKDTRGGEILNVGSRIPSGTYYNTGTQNVILTVVDDIASGITDLVG
jgi:hypothetical protein